MVDLNHKVSPPPDPKPRPDTGPTLTEQMDALAANGKPRWKVVQLGADSYGIEFRGMPWGMEPKQTRHEAQGYMDRLAIRWPDDTAGMFVLGHEKPRPKIGYRYTLANGDTDVIQVGALSTAKKVLRHKLKRKQLPNGTKWEIAT